MNLIFITINIIFLLMFNGCDSGTQRDCLKNKFSVREVLYIGGEADTSDDNPIISFVVDAVSDNFGNIYIFDPITQYIHSYDYNGYYRWTVGGKGHAPGEFQHITSMYTDDDNYLYVYDSRRSILTVFDMNGEMQNVFTLRLAGRQIGKMHILPNGLIALPFYDYNNEYLVHLYSLKNNNVKYSLIDIKDVIMSEDEIEKEFFRNRPGSVFVIRDNLIAYVPEHYSGKIFLFEKNTSGIWYKKSEILGYQAIEPSITFHITKKDFHKRSHMSGYHPTMRGYYVHYEYHSISFGMYKTKLDTMLHLSYLADGDGMRLVVEYFEMKDMSLGRYAIIDILDIDFNPHQHPVWVDKDGYIFIADNTEFPKLRKLKLIHEK